MLYRTLAIAAAVASFCSALAIAAEPPPPESRRQGLILHTYDVGKLSGLRVLVGGQTPNFSKDIDTIDLRNGDFGLKDEFLAEISGFLQIDKPGEYEFQLFSDDGSELIINGHQVIEHDGLHGAREPKYGKVNLTAGAHEILARVFDATVDEQITLKWKPPGETEFAIVPKQAFFSEANVVHVTSPGRKKLMALIPNSRPGDAQPLDAVHPSFTLTTLSNDENFSPKVGGIDFLPDGRVVICTWDPRGDVFFIDPKTFKTQRFATGLAEPLGIQVVDGEVYVLQKQELTHLIDHDKDGIADEYHCLSEGWPVTANFHEFAFGLVYKEGWFYANLAVAINPGGATTNPQVAHTSEGLGRGQTFRIEKETGKIEIVAQGLRTPNGIGLMPSTGDIYITDNQGDWLPCSKLLKLEQGAFYNSHITPDHMWANKPVTPPVAWLPQGEIGNSPSQPVECLVGPWKGQILHGDVTHGGIKRTFVETIETPDGTVDNGAVFRFSQGFNGGVNRLAWSKDNELYVGQIGNSGNWGQQDKKWYGLERITFNDKPTFEMLAVRAKTNGVEIEFTQPIASHIGTEPTHYSVWQWRYEPTAAYGGPKIDDQPLAVKTATVSADRKRVFLELEGMKPDHVVYLRAGDLIRNVDNERLWSTEAWYTLNAIPQNDPGKSEPTPTQNVLTDAEKNDGWTLLFDGTDTSQWKGYQKEGFPSNWKAIDGELRRVSNGGDIVSVEEYADFEFSYEWKVSEAGNSGVFFRVDESINPGWATGIEMQILDNARHADGRNPLTSAGSAYAVIAPTRDATLGPDRWNMARIVAKGSKIQFYLNGEQVADFDTSSAEWKEAVARSKFKGSDKYASTKTGKIVIQDHGDIVAFRNLKIRELK